MTLFREKKKIFISYKYKDTQVFQDKKLELIPSLLVPRVTPRSYLNYLEEVLKDYAIQKWEQDDEDLSQFEDSTIESKLRNKIYDSSLTIVLISLGMRDKREKESEQWIPWEVSYSLRESTRNGRTSKANAMIAIVLPDRNRRYDYCIEKLSCGARNLKFNSSFCFSIIGKNFFNKKSPNKYFCQICQREHWTGSNNNYFVCATWDEFVKAPKTYIKRAYEHQQNITDYNITKIV